MNQYQNQREVLPARVSDTSRVSSLPTIVKPVVSPDEVGEAIVLFEELVKACLTDQDVMMIDASGAMTKDPGRAVNRYIKKSGWRKVALAFNLSWEISNPVYEYGEDKFGKFFVAKVTATVIAPNGRSTQASGLCSSRDPFFSKKKGYEVAPNPEDIAMKAQTVALNRAISDICGSGQLSAEEYKQIEERTEAKRERMDERKKGTHRDTAPTQEAAPHLGPEPKGDKAKIKSEYVEMLRNWTKAAREAGMTPASADRFLAEVHMDAQDDDLFRAEQWLGTHYPDQRPQ